MYNGIGLQTARGSGTNGYVQRNLSHLRPRSLATEVSRHEETRVRNMQPDAGILDHERKRKVEIKCLELRDELEDKGCVTNADSVPEDEVEERVASLRKALLERGPVSVPSYKEAKSLRPSETHSLGAAKEAESHKMQRALGISSTYIEGEAFDRDLQEQRRIERIEERELQQEEARRLYEARREQARADAERILAEKRARDAERSGEERLERRETSPPAPSRVDERYPEAPARHGTAHDERSPPPVSRSHSRTPP